MSNEELAASLDNYCTEKMSLLAIKLRIPLMQVTMEMLAESGDRIGQIYIAAEQRMRDYEAGYDIA